MKKLFFRRLSIVICIAAVITIIIIFVMQTYNSQNDYLEMEKVKIAEIQNKIDENLISIEALKKNLDKDSISKAESFAYMIQQKPEIIEDAQELERIKEFLNVDELHIIDEKGILNWGTEKSMFGFNFADNDQTRPFLEGIKNKNFAFAQEAQENAIFGVLFQYVGVSRKDKPGVVQIGLRPERLQEALENNEISQVLSNMTIGTNGYIFAVNKSDLTIAAYPDKSFIGKSINDIGFSSNFDADNENNGFITLNEESCYYLTQPYNDYIIGAAVPKSEVYAGRNMFCSLVFLLMIVIFGLLIFIVDNMIKKHIVSGVHKIIDNLSEITEGNLDLVVNVRNNKEFIDLSNGINEMVNSIKLKIDEFQQLAKKENKILMSIRDVSDGIDGLSNGMLDISSKLNSGAKEQEQAADRLSTAFESVSECIKGTADKANEAKEFFDSVEEKLSVGNEEMKDMLNSMEDITLQSKKIENIIKTIDDIAFQTNILALNAAVEAARAGTAGKGFSVVADEVRNLAGKSAQSAKDTGDMISKTLSLVEKGSSNALRTASTLSEIMQNSKTSIKIIDSISNSTKEQNELLSHVAEEVSNISYVVSSNSASASESSNISQKLSKEAARLIELTKSE